jgi:hypothetical protein
MNTLKPVRLKHAWQSWPRGHIFTAMPAAQAQMMIAAGQAEYVTSDVPCAPVDRMMRPVDIARRAGGRKQSRFAV